jgi:hypothetical protein
MNPANAPWIYKHHFPNGAPAAEIDLGDSAPPGEAEFRICERLIASYRAAKAHRAPRFSADLWDRVHCDVGKPIDDLVELRNHRGLAELLQNGIRRDFSFGLGSGPAWYARAATGDTDVIRTVIVDRFLSLAEYLGVVPVENPESDSFGSLGYAELSEIAQSVEESLGCDISTPAVFGLFGIRVDGRLLTIRTPDALYVSNAMKQMGDAVLEIGAGFGLCAYYATRQRPAATAGKYTILDLPLTNLLQGYFLLKALGESTVRLFGEEESGQAVSVLPYFSTMDLRARSADVILCQDVFPELGVDKIEYYLSNIGRIGRGVLYTINHEGSYRLKAHATNANAPLPVNVCNHIKDRRGFKTRSRSPYWIRKGYVEEIYEIVK